MPVKLKSIKFNHSSNSITNDAINIRKNKTQDVNVPEWVDGITILAEDSKAAYAMQETDGNTITIHADFQLFNSDANRAQIRAIDTATDPRNRGGCIGWFIYLILSVIKAIFGNVLGEVRAKWVNFNNGQSTYETFELINPKIWTAGVGIHYTEWQWQYRFSTKTSWQNMQISRHKIYIIVESPKSAWSQIASSDQLPWTDVLDYSCAWAFTAKTRDEAATKITDAVYNLGNSVITYDCPGSGGTRYSSPTFNCTKFLERLKGMNGNGEFVNCTDCATIVSTFANILGCDLWQSKMQTLGATFKLNPILAIGNHAWQTACAGFPGWTGIFGYHEVAWKNNCDINDEIFDACLQVDGDSDPRTAPHIPLLPTNMKFGDCSSMNYRLRLSPPVAGGCENCKPDPATKTRREIF